MRPLVWALPLALLLALPAAAAQGCTADAPCQWVVDLDEDGIQDGDDQEARYNGTLGDWYLISLFNFDEAAHTLRFEGYGLEWPVSGVDGYDTEPFQLDRSGEFRLVDEPSQDSAPVAVYGNDAVDVEQGEDPVEDDPSASGDSESSDTPGPGLLLAVAAVALAVLRRRR